MVPDEAELAFAGGSQQGRDRKSHGMAEEVIQLVARMAQRRPISHAAARSGITPTNSLTPKWKLGCLGAHQPVTMLTPVTIEFQTMNAAMARTNQRTPRRL